MYMWCMYFKFTSWLVQYNPGIAIRDSVLSQALEDLKEDKPVSFLLSG